MAYNTHIAAFERHKALLASILLKIELQGVAVLTTDNPNATAYRLREALEAARANNVDIYKDVKLSFRTDKLTSKLLVYTATKEEVTIDESPSIPTAAASINTHPIDTRIRKYSGIVSQFDVVTHVKQLHLPFAAEYPDFHGSIEMVEHWCNDRGFRCSHPPLVIRS